MPGFRRRERDELTVEDEREALRRQRADATEELERLKRELAERVAAVREKERQLDDALGRASAGRGVPAAGAASGSDPREGELARRLAEVAERERRLAAREALPPPPTPAAEQAAHVEARLAELREAERVFTRTQEELAGRSEALSARERLVADRERELDEIEDRAGLGPTRSELAELESRLRRLESTGRVPGDDTQSFAGGLETLRRRGTKRPPGQ